MADAGKKERESEFSFFGPGFDMALSAAAQKGSKLDFQKMLQNTKKHIEAHYGEGSFQVQTGESGNVTDILFKPDYAEEFLSMGLDDLIRDLRTRQNKAEPIEVDRESGKSGATGFQRLQTSLKRSPVGKFRFLQSQLGASNVRQDPQTGEFLVRQDENQPFRPFDPKPSLSLKSFKDAFGDFMDLGGLVVEAVPGMIGAAKGAAAGGTAGSIVPGAGTAVGALIGGLAGGGLGDTGGTVLAHGLDQALPGDSETTAEDFGKDLLFNVGSGALGELGGAAFQAVRGAKGRALQKTVQKGIETRPDLLKEGLELQAETGIRMTPAQLSEEATLQGLEQQARNTSKNAVKSQMRRFGDEQAAQLKAFTEKILDKQLGSKVGAAQASENFGKAYKGLERKLTQERFKVGNEMFEAAFKESGGERIIPLNNFREALQGAMTGGVDADSKAITKKAREFLQEMELNRVPGQEGFDTRATVKQLQDHLRVFGQGRRGGRKISSAELVQDKNFARDMFNALQRDLDEAVEQGIGGQPLREARDTYAGLSRELEQLRKEFIFKKVERMLGAGNLDRLAKDLSSDAYTAPQLEKAFRVMESASDETADAARQLKREILGRQLITKSQVTNATAAGRNMAIDPGRLRRTLANPDTGPKLRAIIGKDGAKALDRVEKISGRLREITNISATGSAGSQTQPLQEIANFARAFMGGLNFAVPPSLMARAEEIFSPKSIIEYIADPEATKILLGITKPKQKHTAKSVARALNQLARYSVKPDDGPGISAAEAQLRPPTPFEGGFAP